MVLRFSVQEDSSSSTSPATMVSARSTSSTSEGPARKSRSESGSGDWRGPGSNAGPLSRTCAPGAPPFPAGVRSEADAIRQLGETRFRCALRSGAGPHRENCPEVGVPVPARHPFPVGYVPRRASYGTWATRGFAALRAAVPGPTGRTARRSAFPCLCVAPLGGLGVCRRTRWCGFFQVGTATARPGAVGKMIR